MTPVVAIVDYGVGNLNSVLNAFQALECEPFLAASQDDLERATHVVLPGVGAFGEGMARLRSAGWEQPLRDAVLDGGRPLLGLCLGMQLLLDSSNEHGNHSGLGWLPGAVHQLEEFPGARVPHIGWNGVSSANGCRLFAGLEDGTDFYFVHSYAAVPQRDEDVAGRSEHGAPFVAALHHGHVHGVQFHPEKSHKAGLALLRNYLAMDASSTC